MTSRPSAFGTRKRIAHARMAWGERGYLWVSCQWHSRDARAPLPGRVLTGRDPKLFEIEVALETAEHFVVDDPFVAE